MPRPRAYTEERVNTQVRLPPKLHKAAKAEAHRRGISFNLYVETALDDKVRADRQARRGT